MTRYKIITARTTKAPSAEAARNSDRIIDEGEGKWWAIRVRSIRVQRTMIQFGRAGEKRMANADDSVMALGVVVHGNAPIKIAARMPNRKPNVVLMPRSCMAADFRIVSTPHSGIGTPRLPTQRARETVN